MLDIYRNRGFLPFGTRFALSKGVFIEKSSTGKQGMKRAHWLTCWRRRKVNRGKGARRKHWQCEAIKRRASLTDWRRRKVSGAKGHGGSKARGLTMGLDFGIMKATRGQSMNFINASTSKQAQAIDLARSLMKQNGLDAWGFDFTGRKRALGFCRYSNKTIYLSTFFVDGKVIAGGKVIDTLNTLQKAKRLFNELFENEGGASLL